MAPSRLNRDVISVVDSSHYQPNIVAYRIRQDRQESIVPSMPFRTLSELLMDYHAITAESMDLASQFGWVLLNPTPFMAMWSGGNNTAAINVDHLGTPVPDTASSHFGYGILTWNPGFVFRTPPGWNLHARGPANRPKRGIVALEGIVETDWAEATFTMNWQMTERNFPVVFEAGEPYCMLVPRRRGELEQFRPSIVSIDSDPDVASMYRQWQQHPNAASADRASRSIQLSQFVDPRKERAQ